MARRATVGLTLAMIFGLMAVVAIAGPAQAGGQAIVITSITVGNPVMTTKDDCNGYVNHGSPVVPLTVGATFVSADGSKPTGPYATGVWSGGYGSSDHHFGTAQGEAHTQFFHILLRTNNFSGWHGSDHYDITATVQDVGLGGGFVQKTVSRFIPPPKPGGTKVKCSMTPPLGPAFLLSQLKDAAVGQLKELACAICVAVEDTYDTVIAYNEIADQLMYNNIADDPPDPDYRQLATPDPPPVLPPSPELTPDQQAAYVRLVSKLADNIGIGRALYKTINRMWGSDNAASRYWYRRQLAAMADLAGAQAAALEELPPLWEALATSVEAGLPDFSVDGLDVTERLADYVGSLPPNVATIATQLGEDDAAQRQMAETIISLVDPDDVAATDGVAALSAHNSVDLARSMRLMQREALASLDQPAPIVTRVTPRQRPAAGGGYAEIHGANLASVTGINFGPSTTTSGQADILSCRETRCGVYLPPGRGTVDVVAIGPGGPSTPVPEARFTYTESTPAVSRVYPSQGRLSGGTPVTIFGSGLEDGTPYFGPAVADYWTCSSDRCTAYPSASAAAGTVDVTVNKTTGRSPRSDAARYTYSAAAPPPPAPPVITGLSPSAGSNLGSEAVTITGRGFTGATDVVFASVDDHHDVTDFAVVSDTEIRATTPGGRPGTVDVVVYTPGGVSGVSGADDFTFVERGPTITTITPSSGPNIGGTEVTITGTDLTGASFEFGHASAHDETCTPTRCVVTTPTVSERDAPTGPVPVTVSTRNGRSAAGPASVFTYAAAPPPVVTSVVADTGTSDGGTTVVLFGTNLKGGRVRFAGEQVGHTDGCDMTSCVVSTPPHAAGSVPVDVSTVAGTSEPSTAASYTYVRQAAPVVTSVVPSSGWMRETDSVQIYGHDLEGGTVSFGGSDAGTEHRCSPTVCTVVSAPWVDSPREVDVRVTTSAGTSPVAATARYEYYAPTVVGLDPASGWNDGQATTTLTGSRLRGARVRFGTRLAPETCQGHTTCTVTVPQHSSTGQVAVEVTAEDQSTRSAPGPQSVFTYATRPLPTVTGLSSTRGPLGGGDLVTVTGTDLAKGGVLVAGSSVTSSCELTECTFTTRARTAGPVDVTVRTTAGTSAAGPPGVYTYEPAVAPTVTSVSPVRGSTLGGTEVTVTGTGLINADVRIAGTLATEDHCTRTVCVVQTRPRAALTGDVVATTAGGSSETGPQARFTYELPPAPVVTGVTPRHGPASGGQPVTVVGENLRGAALTFGNVAVTNEVCTETRCTGTQPPGAPGQVDLVATTVGGVSPVGAASRFTNEPVTITAVPVPGMTTAFGGGVITPGFGGDIWFTVPNHDAVGRVAEDGTMTTFATPDGSAPTGLTRGPDGRMWFTEKSRDRLVAIDAAGAQTPHQLPGVPSDIRHVTAGPDGRLWFTLSTSGAVGAMTPAGEVELFYLPDPYVIPYHLRTGPDGRVWFTEYGGTAVGAITTDGDVTEYELSDDDAVSWEIIDGPDGRLWFAQTKGRALAAVDSGGDVVVHKLPVSAANPQGLVVGPDGRVWFGAPDSDQVSAFDTVSGTTTHYALPVAAHVRGPRYLAMDRRGDLWISGFSARALYRLSGVPPAAPTVSGVSLPFGAAGDVITVTGGHLGSASSVTVGGVAAVFAVIDPAHLRVTVPAGSGTVDIRVMTPLGTSPIGDAARFRYGARPPSTPVVTSSSPSSGSTSGGAVVTIVGDHLIGGSVRFGGVAAERATCTRTQCTATAPPGSPGTVDLTVTTPAGASARVGAARFTYFAPPPPAPVVTSVTPPRGPAGGGTSVTITGSNLTGAQVRFGVKVAPATCTATRCVVTSPAAGVGPVPVHVATDGGESSGGAAPTFTYVSDEATATTTSLEVADATVLVGAPVDLTATVLPAVATGTVTFYDGATSLGTATVSAGRASLRTATLAPGSHGVTAAYSGDDAHLASASDLVVVTVSAPPKPPSAPRSVTARAGPGRAVVTWKAPAAAGTEPISRYRVVPYLGSKKLAAVSTRGAVTRLVVTRLRPGRRYTFRVIAVSTAGSSAMSRPSKAVVPTG